MSLPACEQRVLNHIEAALRASEPHLAAMYATFGRLNAGEPVGAESLVRGRLLRPRATVWAMVLIPVMFAAIVVGALLSGSARGGTTCSTSQSAGRGAPLLSRTSCPAARKSAEGKTTGTASTTALPGREAIQAAPGSPGAGSAGTSCPASTRGDRTALGQLASPPATTGPPAAASGAC